MAKPRQYMVTGSREITEVVLKIRMCEAFFRLCFTHEVPPWSSHHRPLSAECWVVRGTLLRVRRLVWKQVFQSFEPEFSTSVEWKEPRPSSPLKGDLKLIVIMHLKAFQL